MRGFRKLVSLLTLSLGAVQIWAVAGMPGANSLAGLPFAFLYFYFVLGSAPFAGLLVFEALTFGSNFKARGFRDFRLYVVIAGLVTETLTISSDLSLSEDKILEASFFGIAAVFGGIIFYATKRWAGGVPIPAAN